MKVSVLYKKESLSPSIQELVVKSLLFVLNSSIVDCFF